MKMLPVLLVFVAVLGLTVFVVVFGGTTEGFRARMRRKEAYALARCRKAKPAAGLCESDMENNRKLFMSVYAWDFRKFNRCMKKVMRQGADAATAHQHCMPP